MPQNYVLELAKSAAACGDVKIEGGWRMGSEMARWRGGCYYYIRVDWGREV
jgi:hypothetical protein